MSCTTTKAVREREGIDVQAPDRIRSDHIERFQLAALARFHHAGEIEPGSLRNRPLLMEVAGSRCRVIAGQQVGIEAHVRRAARVGVIGEADKFRAGDAGAESDQAGDVVAANFRAENDDEILFAAQLIAERDPRVFIRASRWPGHPRLRSSPARKLATLPSAPAGICVKARRLPPQLDRLRIDHIELRAVQAHVVANLPGQQRMLLGRIVADQQNRRRREDVGHAGSRIGLAAQRRRKGREVGGAVMIDVVRLQHHAREFRQQVRFFIRGARRADHADRRAAILVANFGELLPDQRQTLLPT